MELLSSVGREVRRKFWLVNPAPVLWGGGSRLRESAPDPLPQPGAASTGQTRASATGRGPAPPQALAARNTSRRRAAASIVARDLEKVKRKRRGLEAAFG